jgi:hypothetical protein
MSTENFVENIGKTPRQIADERERERVLRGDYTNTLSHLPSPRTIQGVSPHYSPATAMVHDQALEASLTEQQKRGNGGYYEGCLKQAKQAQHPDRAARIATGIENQIKAERVEAERIANASNQ